MKVIGMSGQYIGKIDGGAPAEAAGLCEGDRIVEVNLFGKYSDIKYLSDPCAHGVRSLGRNSVQELFETL